MPRQKFTPEELSKLKGYCCRQMDFELACKVRDMEPKKKKKQVPPMEESIVDLRIEVSPTFLPIFVNEAKKLLEQLKS